MPLPELNLRALSRDLDHFTTNRDRGDIFDLDAPYQRGSVWTNDQRVALMKSILMGLPIGAIVTSETPPTYPGAHFRVVDGKQRIQTMRAFVGDSLAVPKDWWERRYLESDAWDYKDLVMWRDLNDVGRRHLRHRPVAELVFDGWSRAGVHARGVKFNAELIQAEADLYGLINFAGTPQTAEDQARAEEVARG